MKLDLASFVSEKPLVIEIYICPRKTDGDDLIEIGWDHGKAPAVQTMGTGITSSLRTYIHRDLMYSYDLSNDAQKVTRQIFEHDAKMEHFYIMCYEEEVLPCHRFPCTNEIVHESSLIRTSYRINNRLTFVLDKNQNEQKEYLYVRYHHSPNVDISKMNQDVNTCLRKFIRRK